MPNHHLSIEQLREQSEAWEHFLICLSEENIILKNRLSGILRSMKNSESDFLEQIEHFQNRFLEEDKIISFLHLELTDMKKLLGQEIPAAEILSSAVLEKQKKIRKELETVEKSLNKLKFDFNRYLSEKL